MKIKIFITVLNLFILNSLSVNAKHIFSEKEYQKKWCNSQFDCKMEYKLFDNTRIDCLTPTHAIEFEFANKWAEAIGQSLYYAEVSNRKAGIVLIMEDKEKEQKYLKRLQIVAHKHKIDIWIISPQSMIDF